MGQKASYYSHSMRNRSPEGPGALIYGLCALTAVGGAIGCGESGADTSAPVLLDSVPTTVATAEVPPAPESELPPNVYVLGDSLMVGVEDIEEGGLSDVLTAQGWGEVFVSAAVGRPLTTPETTYECCGNDGPEFTAHPQIQQPEDIAQIQQSRKAVVEIGTNDFSESTETFQQHAEALVGEFRAINPAIEIVWVNTFLPDQSGYQNVNAAIDSLQDDGVTVANYAGVVLPEFYNRSCSDRIHPCDAGDIALRNTIAEVVGSPS